MQKTIQLSLFWLDTSNRINMFYIKRVCYLIMFLFVQTYAFAQTNYYKVDKTFYEDGYTYRCDVEEGTQSVLLYNVENKFTYVDQIIKSTGKEISINDYRESFEDDDWTKDRCRTIVRRTFSAEERRRLQGYGFIIGIYISSETGKIIEVDFDFVTFNPFATIPVSVYRQIEIQLKEKVWFVPTEFGKGLNYIYLCWNYDF